MGLQIHKTITIRNGAASQGIGMYLFSSGCDAFRCVDDKSRSLPPCDSRSMDIFRILLRARSALHDANRRHKLITKRQKLDVLVLLLAACAPQLGIPDTAIVALPQERGFTYGTERRPHRPPASRADAIEKTVR